MSDIEYLKKNKIVRSDDGRVRLTQFGEPQTIEPTDEAYGGQMEVEVDTEVSPEVLRERIVDALRTIYDPEIPLNIYELGLIYKFEIDENRDVEVDMTLTAPACPVAGMLVREVADKVGEVAGVRRSHVRLVWDPPWSKDRMSEEALLELGLL